MKINVETNGADSAVKFLNIVFGGMSMREIECAVITESVKNMFIAANTLLPQDVSERLHTCAACERNERAAGILKLLSENAEIAEATGIPICQDTGMAFVFVTIGQEVHISGGSLRDAINEGVRQAYDKGCLRKSVADPLTRVNTGDNTPAIIYFDITEGDGLEITALPKGFGSENMSRIKMMNPTASEDDIVAFVAETVTAAGGNPCPPTVIGVGIGGSFDYSAYLAKKALARPIGNVNDSRESKLEQKILQALNKTDVGPQGLGGDTTALWVNVETHPTHIASLPVAVNVSCHATRHKSTKL